MVSTRRIAAACSHFEWRGKPTSARGKFHHRLLWGKPTLVSAHPQRSRGSRPLHGQI